MRRLLRIIAWVALVGGCLAGTLGTAAYTLAELHSPHLTLPVSYVVLNALLRGLLAVVNAIAFGGGLLVLLDIDRRLSSRQGAA